MGSGGLCPLMLLPPLGERGGHPRNFHATSNGGEDEQSKFFTIFSLSRHKNRRVLIYICALHYP